MRRILIVLGIIVLSLLCSGCEHNKVVPTNTKPSQTPDKNIGSVENGSVEDNTQKADAVQLEIPVALLTAQKASKGNTSLDNVYFYEADEYDSLYLNDVCYSSHVFFLEDYYKDVPDGSKCAFVMSFIGSTDIGQNETSEKCSDMVKTVSCLGIEVYSSSNDYLLVISDAKAMKKLFTGENEYNGYGEGEGYSKLFFAVYPAKRELFEPETPKALQNIYKAAEPGALSLPEIAATGEVKIMQPSLEKAIRECNDPDVYFPVKMVIQLDAYRKTFSYMSLFNLDDPFLFDGRNFAQNHDYFLNSEVLKEYAEEYSGWFKNVYMGKDYNVTDKDPIDVFSEYYQQSHTAEEYNAYLDTIEKLDEFNRAYRDFIANTVEERMECSLDFSFGPTKAMKDIIGVEYGIRLTGRGIYMLDSFETIYYPDTINVLMNKEQIEALLSNGCEDYSLFLYWADAEPYLK